MAQRVPLPRLVEKWLEWDRDPGTREEINTLSRSQQTQELEKRLRTRIQFGTAGLRAKVQAGFAFMNSLTVIQTSQGIAQYLLDTKPQDRIRPLVVIIGYDTRKDSRKFALRARNAILAKDKNIDARIFNDYVPTPFISFGVRHYAADLGIMITASHNPAQDNGYKVYWNTGCQINSPVDREISERILQNLEPLPSAWIEHEASDIDVTITFRAYLKALATLKTKNPEAPTEPKQDDDATPKPEEQAPAVVYTPLHGVGWKFFKPMTECLHPSYKVVPVPDQIRPDPLFPTVPFPNPEETGALSIATEVAHREGIGLILSNDPDADRFAAMEKLPDGTWFRFTGDQLGVLIASHLLDRYVKEPPAKRLYMLCSAVSTRMLERMLKKHDFSFAETLTGFKWLGNVARELEEDGNIVPFAFEEAIGYMFPRLSYDKDGIAAASVFLEAVAKWKAEGLTPYSQLQELYEIYGYFETANTYFRTTGPSLMPIFEKIRASWQGPQRFGSIFLDRFRDVTNGTDTGLAEGQSPLPVDKSSQMLTFWFNTDVICTLRASGTEPKLKIYVEAPGPKMADARHAAKVCLLTVVIKWILAYGKEYLECSPTVITSSGAKIDLTNPWA